MLAVRPMIFGDRVNQKVDVVLEIFLEERGGVIVFLAIETDVLLAKRLGFLLGFDFLKLGDFVFGDNQEHFKFGLGAEFLLRLDLRN